MFINNIVPLIKAFQTMFSVVQLILEKQLLINEDASKSFNSGVRFVFIDFQTTV